MAEVCDAHGHKRVWSTRAEPDGVLRKACGNRREAVCPACAERYRPDAYHLIAAGLRGGKGVPETIAGHPLVFVTLTAPSFGLVHTRATGPNGTPRRCHPRRNAGTCPHGVRLSCSHVRAEDDPCLGEPICAECFDYDGALLWNNALGELWRRTTIYLPRTLAFLTNRTQKRLRKLVRFSYVKVAEDQRRGLVHLHVVTRLDRAMPKYRADELHAPTRPFDVELLERAIRATAADVSAPLPGELGAGRLRWADALDVPATAAIEPAVPTTPPQLVAQLDHTSRIGPQDIIRCGRGMNPSRPVHGQPVRDQARDRQRQAVEDREASFASDRGS